MNVSTVMTSESSPQVPFFYDQTNFGETCRSTPTQWQHKKSKATAYFWYSEGPTLTIKQLDVYRDPYGTEHAPSSLATPQSPIAQLLQPFMSQLQLLLLRAISRSSHSGLQCLPVPSRPNKGCLCESTTVSLFCWPVNPEPMTQA